MIGAITSTDRYPATRPCGRFAETATMERRVIGSFTLDVRRLEDRPPLLDLSRVVGGERLRILILARRNLLTEIGEPLAHAGIG